MNVRLPAWAALAALFMAAPALAQELPPYLHDRGTGVPTSMFGTYVESGHFLVYPFVEWYADHNLEYKPSELGYGLEQDYRGKYNATEGLVFVAYGFAENFEAELEAAVISAALEKSPTDPSAMPAEVEESGLGDVEGQIRWRWLRETASRPEGFAFFETVFPLQKSRRLIGTQDWEFSLGAGLTHGYHWGTMTVRAGLEYAREEGKVDAGEYAIEYLKKLSRSWRMVAVIEGEQLDEVSFIPEIQWHFARRATLKLNTGIGLTENATDFAPEAGVLFTF